MQFELIEKRLTCARKGSSLILMVVLLVLIVAFMGISIYSGTQAFLVNEAQKNASSAAMAGAAYYYRLDEAGQAVPNAGYAMQTARETFTRAAGASALGSTGFQIESLSDTGSGGINLQVSGALGTSLLAPVGIQEMEVNSEATARALQFVPTEETGPITILPLGGNIATYSRRVNFAFPVMDGPGYDMVIRMNPADQQGYVVEACTETECYDLGPGARPIGTSVIRNVDGATIVYGSAVFDFRQAGVNKFVGLRITHGNQFDWYSNGALQPPSLEPQILTIDDIAIMGYAGACVQPGQCTVPAGYRVVR